MSTSYLLPLILLLSQHDLGTAANFIEGDFVPTARRGQFQGSRTVWHDLPGRHCPRFGRDTKVAIPIPRPKGYKVAHQNYKIQLVFDGDRIYTPWLQIIGKQSPAAPVVQIELEHTGNILTAARAKVIPVRSEYLREHQVLLREFQNATHWPKHLLVHYTWKHANSIHATAGLYLVFIAGLLITITLGLSVIVAYQDKLQAFLSDLAVEEEHARQSASHWAASNPVPGKGD